MGSLSNATELYRSHLDVQDKPWDVPLDKELAYFLSIPEPGVTSPTPPPTQSPADGDMEVVAMETSKASTQKTEMAIIIELVDNMLTFLEKGESDVSERRSSGEQIDHDDLADLEDEEPTPTKDVSNYMDESDSEDDPTFVPSSDDDSDEKSKRKKKQSGLSDDVIFKEESGFCYKKDLKSKDKWMCTLYRKQGDCRARVQLKEGKVVVRIYQHDHPVSAYPPLPPTSTRITTSPPPLQNYSPPPPKNDVSPNQIVNSVTSVPSTSAPFVDSRGYRYIYQGMADNGKWEVKKCHVKQCPATVHVQDGQQVNMLTQHDPQSHSNDFLSTPCIVDEKLLNTDTDKNFIGVYTSDSTIVTCVLHDVNPWLCLGRLYMSKGQAERVLVWHNHRVPQPPPTQDYKQHFMDPRGYSYRFVKLVCEGAEEFEIRKCCLRQKLHCRCRVKTKNGKVVKIINKHNHDPQPDSNSNPTKEKSGDEVQIESSTNSNQNNEEIEIDEDDEEKRVREDAQLLEVVIFPKNVDRFLKQRVDELLRSNTSTTTAIVNCAKCKTPVPLLVTKDALNGDHMIKTHLLSHFKSACFKCAECNSYGRRILLHFEKQHSHLEAVFEDKLEDHAIELCKLTTECFPTEKELRQKTVKKEPIRPRTIPKGPPRVIEVVDLSDSDDGESDTPQEYMKLLKKWESAFNSQSTLDCQYNGCEIRVQDLTASGIDRHIGTHFDKPMFKCRKCGKKVQDGHGHWRTSHSGKPKITDLRQKHQALLIAILQACFPFKQSAVEECPDSANETRATTTENDEIDNAEEAVPAVEKVEKSKESGDKSSSGAGHQVAVSQDKDSSTQQKNVDVQVLPTPAPPPSTDGKKTPVKSREETSQKKVGTIDSYPEPKKFIHLLRKVKEFYPQAIDKGMMECKFERCDTPLDNPSLLGIEVHILSHFTPPIAKCMGCKDQFRSISQSERHLCQNIKVADLRGKYEDKLIDIGKKCFPSISTLDFDAICDKQQTIQEKAEVYVGLLEGLVQKVEGGGKLHCEYKGCQYTMRLPLKVVKNSVEDHIMSHLGSLKLYQCVVCWKKISNQPEFHFRRWHSGAPVNIRDLRCLYEKELLETVSECFPEDQVEKSGDDDASPTKHDRRRHPNLTKPRKSHHKATTAGKTTPKSKGMQSIETKFAGMDKFIKACIKVYDTSGNKCHKYDCGRTLKANCGINYMAEHAIKHFPFGLFKCKSCPAVLKCPENHLAIKHSIKKVEPSMYEDLRPRRERELTSLIYECFADEDNWKNDEISDETEETPPDEVTSPKGNVQTTKQGNSANGEPSTRSLVSEMLSLAKSVGIEGKTSEPPAADKSSSADKQTVKATKDVTLIDLEESFLPRQKTKSTASEVDGNENSPITVPIEDSNLQSIIDQVMSIPNGGKERKRRKGADTSLIRGLTLTHVEEEPTLADMDNHMRVDEEVEPMDTASSTSDKRDPDESVVLCENGEDPSTTVEAEDMNGDMTFEAEFLEFLNFKSLRRYKS